LSYVTSTVLFWINVMNISCNYVNFVVLVRNGGVFIDDLLLPFIN
jgi:hypothetical protein